MVEQLDLQSDDQTKASYRCIEPELLRDLCVVLHSFRGMDSIANNLPFTSDGRIGLIDTEHWDRDEDDTSASAGASFDDDSRGVFDREEDTSTSSSSS